ACRNQTYDTGERDHGDILVWNLGLILSRHENLRSYRAIIWRKPPSDLTAYESYLLGMAAKHGGASGGVTKEGLDEAERLFRNALEIDPQLARAYVGLTYVYAYRLEFGLGIQSGQRQGEN